MTDPRVTGPDTAGRPTDGPPTDAARAADPAGPVEARAPLAEGRWLWRRIYVFGVSLALWSLLAVIVRAGDARVLPRVADGLIGLLALLLVLYLTAPSAQQVIELLANLKLRLGLADRDRNMRP